MYKVHQINFNNLHVSISDPEVYQICPAFCVVVVGLVGQKIPRLWTLVTKNEDIAKRML